MKRKNLPVALRPYQEETLYSWLSRTAAFYRIPLRKLIGHTVPISSLGQVPSEATLETLSLLTRFPVEEIRQVGLHSGIPLPQSWWDILHLKSADSEPLDPDNFRPNVKYCRLCLWTDFVSGRDEILRRTWQFSIPTICPEHCIPLDDRCWRCCYRDSPEMFKTSCGFRVMCSSCKQFVGSPDHGWKSKIVGLSGLRQFEDTLWHALHRVTATRGVNSAARAFVGVVQDLLWILTMPAHSTYSKMFVHFLSETVFRPGGYLPAIHGAHPRLADFIVHNRRWLLSHLAVMLGGSIIRPQLLCNPEGHLLIAPALAVLSSLHKDALWDRVSRWPHSGSFKRAVFSHHCTD